jgi:septal ring-binding cell division protein DamX
MYVAIEAFDELVSAAWNVAARTISPAPAAVSLGRMSPVEKLPPVQRKPPVDNRRVAQQKPAGILEFTSGTRFTLQSATYGNEEFARHDALLLKAKGFQSFLIKSNKFWILCVGNFNNKESATAFLRKLPGEYRSSQVRRF